MPPQERRLRAGWTLYGSLLLITVVLGLCVCLAVLVDQITTAIILALFFLAMYNSFLSWAFEERQGERVRQPSCKALVQNIKRYLGLSSAFEEGPTISPSRTSIQVTESYLKGYFQLSPIAAHYFMLSWRNAQVSKIQLESLPLTTQELSFFYDRWTLLCKTLGQISTLQAMDVTVSMDLTSHARAAAMVFERAHQLTALGLYHKPRSGAGAMVTSGAHILKDGLSCLSNLKSLHYNLPARTYRIIFPALRDLRSLRELSISLDDPEKVVDHVDAQALADSLQDRHFDHVNLLRFGCETAELWKIFCHGISRARIRKFRIFQTHVRDSAQLAESLLAADIIHLDIVSWSKSADSFNTFLAAFAENLPTGLETLCFGRMCGD
jgi:hypothetical protein